MTSPEGQGSFGRFLAALGRALERGVLGRSGHAYMKQFTGSDQYWDRALAAQRDWPREPPPPDPDRRPPGPKPGPVHG